MTEQNTLFDGKPEWFRGYAFSLAEYIVRNDRVFEMGVNTYGLVPTLLSKHITDECTIADVWNIDEYATTESVHSSFDSSAVAGMVELTVVIDCACGRFKKAGVMVESTITDVLAQAFRAE